MACLGRDRSFEWDGAERTATKPRAGTSGHGPQPRCRDIERQGKDSSGARVDKEDRSSRRTEGTLGFQSRWPEREGTDKIYPSHSMEESRGGRKNGV